MRMRMFVCKLLYFLALYYIHLFFEILTILFQDMLDLRHGNNREELGEQEITGKEQAERTEVKTHFPDGWCIIRAPARRQVIALQRCNDDHKPLEPHPNVDEDGHKERYQQIAAHFLEPEDLW
jgi:hypothetical protein